MQCWSKLRIEDSLFPSIVFECKDLCLVYAKGKLCENTGTDVSHESSQEFVSVISLSPATARAGVVALCRLQ